MNNYDRALQLTATSADSAGLSDQRYAAYEESLSGKVKALQASLEELVDSMLNSKFLSFLVDCVQKVLDVINVVQKATNGMAGWTAIILAVVKVLEMLNSKSAMFATILTTLTKFGTWLVGGTKTVTSFATSVAYLGVTSSTTAVATGTLSSTIQALTASFLASPLVAVVGVVAGISLLVSWLDKATVTFDEQKKKVDDLTESMSSLQSEEQNLESKSNRTQDEENRLNYLKAQLTVLQEQKEEEEKIAYQKDIQTKGGKLNGYERTVGYNNNRTSIADNSGLITEASAYDTLTEAKNKATDAQKAYNDAVAADDGSVESAQNIIDLKNANDKASDSYNDLQSKYMDFIDKIDSYGVAGTENIADADEQVYESAKKFVTEQGASASATEDAADAYASATTQISEAEDAYDQFSTTLSNFQSSISDVGNAYKEMEDDGQLSLSTVMSLLESNSDLLQELQVNTDGTYTLSKSAMEDYFNAKKSEVLAELELDMKKTEQAITTAENIITTNNSIIKSNHATYESSLLAAQGITEEMYASQLKKSNDDLAAETTKNKKELETLNTQLKNEKASYKAVTNMTYSFAAGTNAATSAVKSETDALNDATDAAQEYLDTLNDEQDKQNAIAKAIKQIIQNEIDALNDQKDAQDDVYDDKIQALQDQESALEDQYDTEDKLLEIEKARQALEEAKNNKSVRTYSAQTGWYWGSDASDVAEKQSSLDDLMKEWKREQEKKAIEDTISELEKEKKAAEANIQAQIDALNKLKTGWDNATDTTMTDLNKWEGALDYVKQFESGNYDSRISMMNSFTSNYVNLCNQIINAEKAVAAAKANAASAGNATYSGTSSGGGGSSSHTPTVTKQYGAWEIERKYTVPGVSGYFYSMRQKVTTYTDGVVTSTTYNKKTERSSSASAQASKFYASGGVDTEGGPAVLHGKPNAPEVIFNASQAKSLYNFVSDLSKAGSVTNNKTTSNSVTISHMEINAPNGSTFDSIINTAKQRITTTR